MKDQYKVGDFVSTDQFICKTPGRLPAGYGRESQYRHFSGDTIFNDGASGLIWVKNQVSFDANETVINMGCFEQWLRDLRVREVTPCHGDGDYMVSSLWRRFLS